MAAIEEHTLSLGIILLAAGASRRFGRDKLREELHGRPLIEWSIAAAVASGLGPVLVVTRPAQSVSSLAVCCTVNPHPEHGLSSSIHCGLAEAAKQGWGAAILSPADQPLLSPAVFHRLAGALAHGAKIAVASYAGRPRNPVLLVSAQWPQALRLTGDIGLASLARAPGSVRVECGDIASVLDVDTPADLQRVARFLEPSADKEREAGFSGQQSKEQPRAQNSLPA